MTDDLRYPIGRLTVLLPPTDAVRRAALEDIAALPARMRSAVDGLSDTQLDTPYRPGGWTVRQVVHHVPDSHMH
ncbi:MAG: DinB-like domain protein, partial [Acidobacteria bacterium]|nr:DinB-like domain protein [Acidobacteriota bacterium]